jgi:uroporphyrinogen-III synthase
MRFLVTRPQAEAELTVAELRQRGHRALIAPVLAIEPVANAPFDPASFDAIIMTSGNAARALAAHSALPRSLALPVFAVGGRTAQAARDLGFSNVASAEGDATDLLALLRERHGTPGGRLLYLAGSDRSRDLEAELAPGGIRVETVVMYRATAATRLPGDVEQALRDAVVDGVLHYSRRSTAIFLDCADKGRLDAFVRPLAHYCLSQRAAEPLSARGFGKVRIARHPDEAALLDLIASG